MAEENHGEGDLAAVLEAVETLIAEVMPEYHLRNMYGGVMVEGAAGVPATGVCGFFAYTAHVSLEFSKGANFADPHGFLEGKGKYRRHLKLRSVPDLDRKTARDFLQQAKLR